MGSAGNHSLAYLGASSDAGSLHLQDALLGTLRELGYAEGVNLQVERRYSEGDYDRLEELAHEIATHHPDVVYVIGTQAAVAASHAIRDIPMVFASVAYPVAMGLVRSLWAPGTGRTGVANPSDILCRKRIELLKEVFPRARRLAVMHNSRNAVEALMLASIEEACAAHKMALTTIEVRSEHDFAAAFEALRGIHPDALYVIESPLNFVNRSRIVKSVSGEGVAAIYGFSEFADAGGLMSFSFDLVRLVRASAAYVDRIFRGENAAALPVQVPAEFDLVINQRTARMHGVKIPPWVMRRAHRVIE